MKRLASLFAVIALAVILAIGGSGLLPASHAQAIQDKNFRAYTLLASSTKTATGTSTAVCGLGVYTKYGLQIAASTSSCSTALTAARPGSRSRPSPRKPPPETN
jgi:hypothetical protein